MHLFLARPVCLWKECSTACSFVCADVTSIFKRSLRILQAPHRQVWPRVFIDDRDFSARVRKMPSGRPRWLLRAVRAKPRDGQLACRAWNTNTNVCLCGGGCLMLNRLNLSIDFETGHVFSWTNLYSVFQRPIRWYDEDEYDDDDDERVSVVRNSNLSKRSGQWLVTLWHAASKRLFSRCWLISMYYRRVLNHYYLSILACST